MATGFQTPEFSLEEQRRALDPDYDKQRTAEEALEKADEQVQDLLAMGAGYGNNTHSNLAPEGIAEDPLTPDERRDANNRYDKQNQGKLNVPTDSPLFSFDLDKAKELAQQQRDIEIVPRFGKWEDMSPAERGEEAYRQVEKEMQENPQARAGVEGTSIVGKDNIPILGSFLTAADASALQVTAKNIVDGKAEPADYILFAKAMHQANHDAQKGLLEQTGEAIVDVGSLMLDYALSGGALSGKGLGNATEASVAGTKAAEGVVKKEIFDKALEKIGKGWFKQGALKTGQHVSKVAVNAAKRGVMYAPRAAETMAGRGSIDDFIIDKKGNYQFKEEEDSAGRDLFEAVATAYAEIVIEEIIPDGVLAGLAKGSKSKAIKKLGEFMTKAGKTKVGKAASVGGFGGMLGEIGEERLTELANYVITNEEDQLGTSKAIWDAVTSGDPEKINKAFEMAVPEVGAVSFIAAGRAGAARLEKRKNIPASPDVIPGAADVDEIQDIQVEPGQRQEIAPEDMPDVQVEPTDLTQRAERPIEGETGHIGADGTPVRTSKPAPPVPRAEVLPEGHPALGDVDTRAEPPEVKIPDLKPDHIQGDPDPQAPLEIPPPTTDDTVEAPPVIPDVEAPPVIEDKPDLKPSHIKDDVDPQAPLTPDYTDSIKTDVPVAKRATRAQQAEQTQQMDTSGDINNPIERLDMKDEGNYREDIDALIKRSKKAGGKVSRNDIKSIGYLDGNLYDNKNYDFSKASERKRFVKEAEQRLKEGRQQTQKAQEQQRQPVVKVVPEPTKTKPLKLKDALKNVQEQERYKEAEEIKGSRQAASRYDIDYGEQRRQEKRDTAAREINKVLMKGIPAKSDNEQENNERSQLIHERLNSLARNMGVEVDTGMSIKEKKDAILDKNEQTEQEDFEATVKEGMERDKRTSPWLDIEANWEAETKAKVPLPPGYGYSKDGKIIKPGQKVSKAKKSTAEQRPKATNESLKRLNEINNEIANLKVKPQNADTRGKIENLQQEREDIVNAHNARVIKRTKPDPTKEPSKQGKPTAKEEQLKKEEQTETEEIQSEIDKEVERYSKIENPTENQIGYNSRKLKRLREKKANLEREYEAAQDEVAEEKETKAQEKAEVQEEGTALERMQKLDLELTKLQRQGQDAPTRAKIAQIQADKNNLAKEVSQELESQQKKEVQPPPLPTKAEVKPPPLPTKAEVKPPPLPTAKEAESLVPKDVPIYEVIHTSTDRYRDVLARGPVPSLLNRSWIRRGVSGHSNELEDTGGKNHAFTINPSRRAGQRNQGALTQVGFPGRDKTGRSNFMAHSFVINIKGGLDISPAKIIKQIEFENDWKRYSDVQDHVKEQTKKPTIDNIVNIETPSVISNELAQEIADAILDKKTNQVQIVYDSKNLPSNLDVMIQVSELLPKKEQWKTTFSTQHEEGSKKDNSIKVLFLHAEDANSPSSRVKVFNIINEVKSKPEPKPEPKIEPKVEPEPPKKTPAQKKKAEEAGKAKYSRTQLNKDIKEFLGPGISLQANKEGGKDSFIIKTTRNAQFKLKPDASIIINEPLIKEGESVEDAQDRWMDSVLDPILMPKDETPTITQEQVPEIDHVEESTDTLKELIEEEQQSKKAKKGTPKSQVNVEGTPQAEWVEKAVDNEQWVMEQLKEIGVDVNNLTILPDQFDEAFHDRDAPKDFSDIVYGDNRKGKDGKAIDISKLEGDKGWKMVLEALLQKRAVHLSLNKANFQYKPNTLEVLNKQLEKSLAAIGKTVQTATAEELKVISNNVAQQMAKRAEPARVYDHMVFDKKNLRLISQDGTFTLEWKYNPADAYGSFVVGGPAIGHHNNKEIPFNIEMAIKMTPEEFSTTNWDMSTVPPSAKTVLMGKEWDKLSDKEKKKYDNKKDYDLRRVTSFHENLIRWTVPKETSGAKSTENLNKDTTIAQEAEMKARTYRRRTPYKVMKAYPDIFSKELKEFEQRREEKLGPNPPAPSDNLSLEHIEHLFSPLDVKPMRNVPANLQVNEKAVRAFAGGVTIAKTRGGYVIRTPRGDVNIVHVNDIRHLDGMELKRYEGVYTKKQLEAAAKHQPMGVYVRGKGKRKYGVTDLGTIYLNSHPDSMADMGTLTEELFHVADVMGFINSADRRKLVQKYSSLDKDFLTQSEEIAHALKKMERKDRTFVLGALRKFLRKLMKLFNIDDSVGRVMLDAMKTGTIWETRDDVRAKRINSMLDARDLLFSPSTTPPRRQARKTKEQVAAESTPAGAAASLPARKEYDENLIRERDAENRRQARAQINNDGFMNSVEDVLNKFNNMSMLGMSSVDMQKAKLLHDQFFELEQDPTHSSNPEFILLASYYREAYRYAGTVAARALNARKNPALTEEEAIEATLIEAVYMPNSKKARRLAELVGVAKEYSSPSLMDSDMLSGDSVTIDNDGNIVGTQGGTGGVPAGQGPGKGPGQGPGQGPGAGKGQGPGAGKGTSFPGWNAASISKLPKSKQAEARNILNDLIKERKELLDFLRRQGFDLSKSGLAAIRKNPVRARQLLDAVSWKKAHQVDKVFAWLKHIFYNNLLSGIRTQVTNITSNIVYRKYRQFEQAAGRALFFGLSDINAIEKSLTGADLKEWKRVVRKIERTASQARGTGKVLSNEYQEALDFINRGMGAAFANAVSTFHTDQSAVDSERLTADELDWYRKEGIVTPVATSSFGKKFISITGTPTKLLRSGDEFFRSLTLNNLAGAFAASEARLAVARGDIGTADIDAYIIKQLNNRNSHAWDRAHKAASELVHQETDEGVRGFVINLIETVDKKIKSIKDVSVDTKFSTVAHLTANILDLGLRVFALPFRRTPINLIGKGIARSPVLGMSLNGLQVIKNKAEGRAAFDGIEGESFASLMSTIMMMAMIAWGDDEEEGIGWKNFGWTGTRQGRDYREKIHGYREGVAGPNQLRLFGHTFNYANVEPFSSAMSIMADIADAHKDDDSVMGELVKAPANLVEDRSFTQGLDNWYKVTRGEDRAAGVFADALSSFLVPNLVKQLSRESKNYVTSKTADSFMGRLKKSAELPEWLNKMIGIDKTPPVVDAWGMVARNEFREPFSKGIGSEATGLLANLASPMFKYSGSNETFIGDKPYVEWNRANPDNKMFPMSFAGKPWERSFTYKGTKYQMSESDYAHMQYYAGGIAAELAKSLVSPKMAEELSKKTEHQAKFDMLRIKEFRRKSFEYVRSAYLKKRMYDVDIEKGAKAVIDDIKESYLEANSGKTKAWLKNEFLNQPDSDEYKDALAWRRYYEWITRGQ